MLRKHPLTIALLVILSIAHSHLIMAADAGTNNALTDSPNGTLIFAVDIIRHGDRTPTAEIPADPHVWPEGLGKLTPLGMRQEYDLGKKLNQRYIQTSPLLNSHYGSGTILVHATDYDRTMMSAQSLLLGLYPPGQGPYINDQSQPALPNAYQPIPVHTVPLYDLALPSPKNNPSYDELASNNVFQTAEWKKNANEVTPYFSSWSAATGITLTDSYQLMSLADILFIRNIYSIPLPPGLSQEDANTIISIGQWEAAAIFKNKNITQPIAAPLLQSIANYLQQASQQKTPLSYLLYSAHDMTLLCLASALGAPLDKKPPYASDLNISLFDQGNKNYRVVITYNDQPLILPCTGTNSCSLEQFSNLIGP